MKRNKPRYLAVWSWLILLPNFSFLVLLFSLAGADFVISTAYWENALIWSVFLFFSWAFVLWISHIYSPDLSLILSALLWICIVIGSQWDYYLSQRNEVVRYQYQEKEEILKNSQLDLNKIYNLYMQKVLNDPNVHGWWGHIKLITHEGIINRERLGMRKTGGKFAEVERHGWQVIVAWLFSYLFLACACLLGMIGAAIRNPQEKQQVVIKHQKNSDANAKPYFYQPMNLSKHKTITPQTVARLIEIQNQDLTNLLTKDLLIVSNCIKEYDIPCKVDKSQKIVIDQLVKKFRPFNQNRTAYRPEYMMMHSALIYQQHVDDLDYYHCLGKISAVYAYFQLSRQVLPFQNIDLSGLVYKPVAIDPLWRMLVGKGANFYDQGSAWELIEKEAAEDIPEGAYLAILYQAIHAPDRRVHEWWGGVEPHELIQRLGSRLRDALLTYLHDWPTWFSDHEYYRLERLTAIVGQWPEEIAAPILERCIRSGWRNSCSQIPETPFWIEFLENYEPTPFGSLKNYVRWYSNKKYSK